MKIIKSDLNLCVMEVIIEQYGIITNLQDNF